MKHLPMTSIAKPNLKRSKYKKMCCKLTWALESNFVVGTDCSPGLFLVDAFESLLFVEFLEVLEIGVVDKNVVAHASYLEV